MRLWIRSSGLDLSIVQGAQAGGKAGVKRRHHLEFGLCAITLALLTCASWFFRAHDPFKLFLAAGWCALGVRRLWLYWQRSDAPLKP